MSNDFYCTENEWDCPGACEGEHTRQKPHYAEQVTAEELMKSLPVPAAWAATFNLKDYWTNQENVQREQAQLEACERDDELEQDGFMPGYDITDG